MSNVRQFPTRQDVLIHFANIHRMRNSLSVADFAEALAKNYTNMVAERARSVALKVCSRNAPAAEYTALKSSNTKLVQRYLDSSQHFPVEVEESWIATLDADLQRDCIHALCARYGVLPVQVEAAATVSGLGEVLKEHAEAMTAEAPMLADGKIDDDDIEHAPAAYREHIQAGAAHIGHALSIRKRFPCAKYDAPLLKVVGGK